MKKGLFILLLGLLIQNVKGQQEEFMHNADSIVSLMTLEEKLDMIAGYKNFSIKGIERLNLPPVTFADGPMGVKGHGKATAFPASICMAATWNPGLIEETGKAIGAEARSKGIGVLLAPGMNVYRVPHCGRNFEYYGEDPLLISSMASHFIIGVQQNRMIATAKHFVANNQDYDRHRVSSDIDERTLQEIYFPAFKASVKEGNAGAIMTSYNMLNGIHTSESEYLIKQILRKDWGFEGIVMSDWISVYSTQAFPNGLDLEMPRAQYMHRDSLMPLFDSGVYQIKDLDEKVRNIVSTCLKYDLYSDSEEEIPNWKEHGQIARHVAREGFVLLKNDEQFLPFIKKKQKIAVLGPNALYTPYSGGGAAMIEAYKMVSFFDGIKDHASEGMQVDYVPTEGLYNSYAKVNREYFVENLQKLKNYDAVVLCIGFNPETEGEGFDRPFALPGNQQWLINKVTEINPNTLLVLNAGGGVFMPWLNKVKALLHTWYPGQEAGEALGELIFGSYSPSGKLPISIEKQWKDNAAFSSYDTIHAKPGAKPLYTLWGEQHDTLNMSYDEGIFIGYRHHDYNKIEALFPFGFGLSYSTFELSDIHINKNIVYGDDKLILSCKIKNTGKFKGAEVIQLYIGDPVCSVPRPIKELKTFEKVFLHPGETKKITFQVTPEMLQFFHPKQRKWVAENGEFEIQLGTSSKNIQFIKRFNYQNQ